jgi:hypothetical protein
MVDAVAAPDGKARAECWLKRFDRPDRGLWRFLTWSFFVAQLWLGAPFLESESKASSDQQDASDQPTDHASAIASNANDTPSFPPIRMSADEQADNDGTVHGRMHAAALNEFRQLEDATTMNSLRPISQPAPYAGAEGGGGGDGGDENGGEEGDNSSTSYDSPTSDLVAELSDRADRDDSQVVRSPEIEPHAATAIHGSSVHVDANLNIGVGRVDLSGGELKDANHAGALNFDFLGSQLSGIAAAGTAIGPAATIDVHISPGLAVQFDAHEAVSSLVHLDVRLGGDLQVGSLSSLSQLISTEINSTVTLGVDLSRIGLDAQLDAASSLGAANPAHVDFNSGMLNLDPFSSLSQSVSITTIGSVTTATVQGELNGPNGTLAALSSGHGLTTRLGDAVGSDVIGALPRSATDATAKELGFPGNHTSIVSDLGGLTSLQRTGDVSSGDNIVFLNPAPITAQVDHLFASGQYTPLGITLHSSSVADIGNSQSELISPPLDSGSSSLVDAPHQQHDPSSSQLSTATNSVINASAPAPIGSSLSLVAPDPSQLHDHQIGVSTIVPAVHIASM